MSVETQLKHFVSLFSLFLSIVSSFYLKVSVDSSADEGYGRFLSPGVAFGDGEK